LPAFFAVFLAAVFFAAFFFFAGTDPPPPFGRSAFLGHGTRTVASLITSLDVFKESE
jgi:hypothetical protein